MGLFADETDASTDIQVAVNLGGVLNGTKLALARMRPRGRGHIVNVAWIGGKIASPGGATYSATKHAVVGLSESLRGELRGSGVAVSIVMPAIIATEMADGLGSARGVRPVEPAVVGEAIVVRCGADGARMCTCPDTPARSIPRCRCCRGVGGCNSTSHASGHGAHGGRSISARRIQHTRHSRGQTARGSTQFNCAARLKHSALPPNPGDHHRCRRQVSHL